MRILKFITSLILFITITVLSVQVISQSKQTQAIKRDYAEINHFKYGLFSVEAWKRQLSKIISDEIDSLYLTRRNEKVLKNHLEVQLEILIDKIITRIKKSNYKTAQGWIKQGFIDSFINVEEIKAGIPEYAQAILAEMTTSKSEAQIKGLLKDKIGQYIKKTFDTNDISSKSMIIKQYKAADDEDAKNVIEKILFRKQSHISEQSVIMIILALLLFVLEVFNKKPLPQSQYILMTLTLLVLLITGIATPMIDMEAKITQLSFVLFDHPVRFDNQVLYFQSKSILDVFWVMITHKDFQMKFVGMLLVTFSVVFPVFKMLSSLAYYYDYCRARSYRLVQFFVLKSGKWSMADVMVVAIFMAYIGFNGIINNQLGEMKLTNENVEIMTTNGTNLQPGYYLFITYTILAMFLSSLLKSRPYDCSRNQTV